MGKNMSRRKKEHLSMSMGMSISVAPNFGVDTVFRRDATQFVEPCVRVRVCVCVSVCVRWRMCMCA